MDERELIYDWNRAGPAFDWSRARVDLNDETLRDGLQSPSVRDPSLEVKKRLLHLMADIGIVAADIGLPGAGPRVVEQVRVLAREIRGSAGRSRPAPPRPPGPCACPARRPSRRGRESRWSPPARPPRRRHR